MSASGAQGCPLAGIAQTRTVAPASGIPRELKTMSSLREPCACAGPTAPGTTCKASARNAQRNVIVLAHAAACDAIFDRIIAAFFGTSVNLNSLLRRARMIICDRHGK